MRTAHIPCGLGGSLWAGAILGWESVYALDYDPWRVLRVRDQAAAGWWPGLRCDRADLGTWNPPALDGGVDCLAAGFSCKDISSAGRGAGLHGASTGPTYSGCLRAIDAWRPRWVFFENSPKIRTRGRDQVTADLVARGYRWKDGILAAAEIGAPHQRDRWFLLAHLSDADLRGREGWSGTFGEGRRHELADGGKSPADLDRIGVDGLPDNAGRYHDYGPQAGWEESPSWSAERPETPTDAMRHGLQIAIQRGGVSSASGAAIQAAAGYCGAHHWNPPDPHVLRVVDGLAAELDRGRRIEALGDAWVPLAAAVAWRILGGP